MVLGRTHIKEVAAKRKVELNSYIQSLMNGSAEVAEVNIQRFSINLTFNFDVLVHFKLMCNLFFPNSV